MKQDLADSPPPLPYAVCGSRIYAADGEEIAVATKASGQYRRVTERTAEVLAAAVNERAALRDALHRLGMLALQSARYGVDAEFRHATDAALALGEETKP